MKRPGAHPTALAELLPGALQNLGAKARPTREMVQEAWERLVSKEAARHSRPHRLSQGRLTVEVENSAWMYTLSLRKEPLLQGLIELLGASRVRQIRFRMGEIEDA